MPKEIKTVTLEDNITYAIIDVIENNQQRYVYLTNIDDDTDFCIRKLVKEDNEELLIGLNNEEEFKTALAIFQNKHDK